MSSKIKEIVLGSVIIYMETDSDGYVSFSTDGLRPELANRVIEALRAAQNDDDREAEAIFNQPHRFRR